VVLGPVVDVTTSATRHPVTDEVEPPHLKAGSGELVSHGLVAARMLGDPVDQDDVGDRFSLGCPVTDQLGSVPWVGPGYGDAQSQRYSGMSSGKRDHAKPRCGVNAVIPPPCSSDQASACGVLAGAYLRAYSAARFAPVSRST